MLDAGSGIRLLTTVERGKRLGAAVRLLTSAATIGRELGAVGATAEEVVGFVEDELAFEVLELEAGGKERDGFVGFGGVVIFSQGKDFAIQTAQGGDEFGVGFGLFGDVGGGK